MPPRRKRRAPKFDQDSKKVLQESAAVRLSSGRSTSRHGLKPNLGKRVRAGEPTDVTTMNGHGLCVWIGDPFEGRGGKFVTLVHKEFSAYHTILAINTSETIKFPTTTFK